MEIAVKKLISARQYEGTFEFDYQPSDALCLVPLSKIDGAIKVYGNYIIYDDDSVSVYFTVGYRLKGQCSYCLGDAEKDISFSSDVLFVPEKDDENYFYDGIKIDLQTAVNDAILISQPGVLPCKEDCEGIDVDRIKK